MDASIVCDCGATARVIRYVHLPGELEQEGKAKGGPLLKPYFVIACPKCGQRTVKAKLLQT